MSNLLDCWAATAAVTRAAQRCGFQARVKLAARVPFPSVGLANAAEVSGASSARNSQRSELRCSHELAFAP